MNEEESSLVMVELEIQGLSDNIYRYQLDRGEKN